MIGQNFENFFETQFLEYINNITNQPINVVTTVIDLVIVIFLIYKAFKMLKETRAWQLLKGILILIVITVVSGLLKLNILNYILTSLMSYGVIMLIIVFQPELRRGLEQLGTTNRFSRMLGMDEDLNAKKKENIYKIAIAAVELAKLKET